MTSSKETPITLVFTTTAPRVAYHYFANADASGWSMSFQEAPWPSQPNRSFFEPRDQDDLFRDDLEVLQGDHFSRADPLLAVELR